MSLELERFFERAAIAPMRASILSGEAAIVFSAAFDQVLWANAEGARLFGGGTVTELLESPISTSHSFIRQVHDAAEQIEDDQPIVRGFRISRGLTAQFIQCELRPLTVDEDQHAILLSCAPPDASGHKREHERAKDAVSGLADLAWASAIIDGSGLPLAVSERYAQIEIDNETMAGWLDAANTADAGLHTVLASSGLEHTARLLRLSDHPQRFLIGFGEVETVDEQAAELTEEQDEGSSTPILAAAAAGTAIAGSAAGTALAAGTGDDETPEEQLADAEVTEPDGDSEQSAVSLDNELSASNDEPADLSGVREETSEAENDVPESGEAQLAEEAGSETVEETAAVEGPGTEFRGGMHQAMPDETDFEQEDDEPATAEQGVVQAEAAAPVSDLEVSVGQEAEIPEPAADATEAVSETDDRGSEQESAKVAEPDEIAGEAQSDDAEDDTVEAAANEEAAEPEIAQAEDEATAGAVQQRPKPFRSLLERWFMRRGDEEPTDEDVSGEGQQEVSEQEGSSEPVMAADNLAGASGGSESESSDDAGAAEGADESTDEAGDDGNTLTAAGVAAGAGLIATTVALAPSSDEEDDSADSTTDAATATVDETQPAENDETAVAEQTPEKEPEAGLAADEAELDTNLGAEESTEFDEAETEEASAFAFSETGEPVRFAWTTDDNQTFVSVSPELAETVGPNAADIIGRKWQDVSKVFGFDENGEIAGLLENRDTWSGKSVLWPVQGADLTVPVDLAALPAFSASRAFEGFRGFGIIRTADAVVDPDEIGLALAGAYSTDADDPARADDGTGDGEESAQSIEQRVIAGSPGEVEGDDEEASDANAGLASTVGAVGAGAALAGIAASNVVDLTSRKRAASGGEETEEAATDEAQVDPYAPLSGREAMAFEEIGRRLGGDGDERAAQPVPGRDSASSAQAAILEQLPVPVIVYRNGHSLFANKELLAQTGYADTAAIDAAGGVEALFGDAAISEGDDSTQKLRCQDGSEIEVSPLLKSVPWDGGKALLLTFRPTTLPPAQVREAIDIARVSELQNILDTASDGIVVVDGDGLIESVNAPAEQLFGVGFDDAARRHVTELFAQESHKAINDYVAEAANPARPATANQGREAIGKHADGALMPLFVTLGRMGDGNKLCAVLRNISRWKKVEEDLVGARKAAETASEHKSDFLARVSHEIRTPLNAIIGFSDVMIEERFGPVDNERYREYLRDINRSGVHILDLINDLLDISKIEAGKMELSFEAVDLSQIVAETVALLQPQANVERILIRTSLSRAVPRVVADARTIRQIVLNLVSNAIKFTAQNGQVIISTVYETNGEVVLNIRDTGKGMSEAELEQALKPFSQIGTVDDRRGQGTGLGLPLTKALVEANRAHFDLESEPGEGTIAVVQFPTQRVLAD